MAKKQYDVKNLKLADQGKKRIDWADEAMPVLRKVRERFAKVKPVRCLRFATLASRRAISSRLRISGSFCAFFGRGTADAARARPSVIS